MGFIAPFGPFFFTKINKPGNIQFFLSPEILRPSTKCSAQRWEMLAGARSLKMGFVKKNEIRGK